MASIEFVAIIVVVALLFDFWNGMNDAANSVATVVATRVLSPRLAVTWAAFWNFVAAFGFGVAVATTIGKGVVQAKVVDEYVILAGLIGAMVWIVATTHVGLPISASHTLIGGLVGAVWAKAGVEALIFDGIVKVLGFMIVAPLIGLLGSAASMLIIFRLFRHSSPGKYDRYFRRLQLVSAALYSLGHGTNDAQKTMGVIAVLLFSTGFLGQEFYVPVWVILSAHAAIALGTFAGGWKVIRTMGMKITKLQPVGGFSAESASAAILFGTALAGIPVSTTHTIAGAIMGVGSVKRLKAVRWTEARRIVWAWIITIPVSAFISATVMGVIKNFL